MRVVSSCSCPCLTARRHGRRGFRTSITSRGEIDLTPDEVMPFVAVKQILHLGERLDRLKTIRSCEGRRSLGLSETRLIHTNFEFLQRATLLSTKPSAATSYQRRLRIRNASGETKALYSEPTTTQYSWGYDRFRHYNSRLR